MGRLHRVHAGRTLGITIVLLLLLALGLVAGLGQAAASSPSPAASGDAAASPGAGKVILRIGYVGEPDNLNPFVAQVMGSYLIFATNYDFLVGIDPATLVPSKETGLAEDWTVSDDGLIWTFTLRDGPAWQDNGQPVTSADVEFMYDYILDNDMTAYTSFAAGITEVTALDPMTVQFVTEEPKADMLLALNSIPILPEHIWKDVPPKLAGTTYPNKPPIVGSGAFQCVEYKKSSYVIMEANKEYWRGAPHIDQLIFQCYTNDDTLAQDLKAGSLDGAMQMLNSQIQLFDDTPAVTVESIPVNGYDDVVINCYVPPEGVRSLGNPVLQDAEFRQALQYAVDRDKMVSIVYYGNARPADTIITSEYYTDPDWHWTPPADQAYSYDLAEADAMLTAAGYPLEGGVRVDKQGKPITLRLWSRQSSAESQQEGKLLAGAFRDLGIEIEYEVMDNGALLDKIYNTQGDEFLPDFDLCIWGWYNSIDPGQATSYFCTDQIGGWSDCAYSNPEYDALYMKQLHAIDPTERKAIIDRMQQIIYEESPYLVLTYSNDAEGWNTAKWEGWVRSPAEDGIVLNQTNGVFTYLEVRPKVAEESTTASGGGSSTTTWIVVGVVAAIVVILVAVVFMRRSRGRALEE
jgi:peptide/nickel transport system substrate-binding protein